MKGGEGGMPRIYRAMLVAPDGKPLTGQDGKMSGVRLKIDIMAFEEYCRAIASTRDEWVIDEVVS
jgi:hypothetical protein